MSRGNKFKFIQKTDKIIGHRGDNIDDGMIRVEYRYEKHPDVHITTWEHHHIDYDYSPRRWRRNRRSNDNPFWINNYGTTTGNIPVGYSNSEDMSYKSALSSSDIQMTNLSDISNATSLINNQSESYYFNS